MKFLIAIVLYRVERKLTPLLKTNLSVFVLPVFPSFPVLDSAARDSALVLPRCLCRSRLLESVSRTHLTSKGRTCSPQSQAGCGESRGCTRSTCLARSRGLSPRLLFLAGATPHPTPMDRPVLCGRRASVRADELGHHRERPGKALGWTLGGSTHTCTP